MLRNAKTLEKYELKARDGTIGHVKDFFFDDRHWTTRYLIVDTGTWLNARNVLVSPHSIEGSDWDKRVLTVDLTKDQIRNSPGLDLAHPVSRQYETQLSEYYGWPAYWGALAYSGAALGAPLIAVPPVEPIPDPAIRPPAQAYLDAREVEATAGDPHLHSVRDVTGDHIEARDGSIGHVEDFLIDDSSWEIKYLVVDTKNWWPGRKVVISPAWITSFGESDSKVRIDLSREAIKAAPAYDPRAPLEPAYSDRLHDHYQRPRYNAW